MDCPSRFALVALLATLAAEPAPAQEPDTRPWEQEIREAVQTALAETGVPGLLVVVVDDVDVEVVEVDEVDVVVVVDVDVEDVEVDEVDEVDVVDVVDVVEEYKPWI